MNTSEEQVHLSGDPATCEQSSTSSAGEQFVAPKLVWNLLLEQHFQPDDCTADKKDNYCPGGCLLGSCRKLLYFSFSNILCVFAKRTYWTIELSLRELQKNYLKRPSVKVMHVHLSGHKAMSLACEKKLIFCGCERMTHRCLRYKQNYFW